MNSVSQNSSSTMTLSLCMKNKKKKDDETEITAETTEMERFACHQDNDTRLTSCQAADDVKRTQWATLSRRLRRPAADTPASVLLLPGSFPITPAIGLPLRTALMSLLLLLLVRTPPICCGRTPVHLQAIIPDHFTMAKDLNYSLFHAFVLMKRDQRFSRVFQMFTVSHNMTVLSLDEPMEILTSFCQDVLGNPTVLVFNINNPFMSRRSSANAYVMDLTQHLGLPVIAWDAEYAGTPKDPEASLTLHIAPTVQHQARAIFSLLQRYNWTQFSVVTSSVAGHQVLVSTLASLALYSQQQARIAVQPAGGSRSFQLLQEVLVRDWRNDTLVKYELNKLMGTDTRIIILHARSGAECYTILETAAKLGLTGREYQWILTQAAISFDMKANEAFPVGTLGLRFSHDLEAMKKAIKTAVRVLFTALLDMAHKPAEVQQSMTFPESQNCSKSDADLSWPDGRKMYHYLQQIQIAGEPQLRFNENGTLQQTEVKIINCQWEDSDGRLDLGTKKWKEVGTWMRHGLRMEDIVWPGGSAVPPSGMPARTFLRIATLEEKPYVMYVDPDSNGGCTEHAVHVRMYRRDEKKRRLSNSTEPMCAVGLSVDLLRVFSRELAFDYDLFDVEDGMWGAKDQTTGRWNGPIKLLLDREADMVVTSLKINPDRNSAVRFSVPYLETGITIVVSLREGAISPTAFLEPYDYPSWCLILVFSVHATGASIFIFEWLSPYGLNRGKTFCPDHKFSLFRSFWMIWAMLFSAAVDTDGPKGVSSRFLANIWALFALVFLASYTANLAAFMITKEEYYDLSGIQDWRLQNPTHMKPPFKYATIPEGSTETNIRNNHPAMYRYMKPFNKMSVGIGIEAVKRGEIQAFIYDATVLEYYVGKDPGCKLRTVGNWYAMTGYGVAFPPGENNPWISKINNVIFRLQENGEMERLQKFWLAGACYSEKEKKGVTNKTLGILNFTSAFILLGGGVLLSVILLVLECLYFRFGRRCLRRCNTCHFCALISLSLGRSLEEEETVEVKPRPLQKRCKDSICDTQIWRLKHQLDMALLKIENLQNQLSMGGSDSRVPPDLTRQTAYTDVVAQADYVLYNGSARRHGPPHLDSPECQRLLHDGGGGDHEHDHYSDSRSEGGGGGGEGSRRIRRSPSYTCAIGGDLVSETQHQSQHQGPASSARSRHHEGKMYVGVDSSANSSESIW